MAATAEMTDYEAKVDKLCADHVQQIAKKAKDAKMAIDDIVSGLSKEICKVEVPKQLADKEVKQIPDRINAIMKSKCTRVLKKNADVKFVFDVDLKNKLLRIRGHEFASIL